MQQHNRGSGSGSIVVVGLGPGDRELLTPQALFALEKAQVIVGYTTYIDLLDKNLRQAKEILSTGMKKEVDRVAMAIEKAVAGKAVAVISSGDAGIYGMAGLVLELLEKKELLAVVDVEIIPGIPALAAGAALLGAPLIHDFAVISLSDLLTPFALIEKRLFHATLADFSLVLYNPRSKRRNWQLQRAVEIIAQERTPSTPVGMVHNAWRTGQKITTTTLQSFDPHQADMLSIIFIGNSTTRLVQGKMLTPRGYLDKYCVK